MVTKKTKPQTPLSFSIPKASAADLRGRQSVRVSFKLSPNCIDAITILGSHLRLKPKSLFDHMVQKRDVLEAVAATIKTDTTEDAPRQVKAYVISREAVFVLDEVAHIRNVPRDALVEASVMRFMPLIQKEQTRHHARKALLLRMERHLKSGRKLFDDMKGDLGSNDPMCDQMKNVMGAYERAFAAMAAFVGKGKNIEGFDADV
ncbi:MAG: hypothetical protein HF981_03035 [Desulfobacteraceae bacterium]|nr:hypothetical protein [Desulfobacteraceae bacterium]MBC2749340.1 hypothetical protein [Desulfobacteraceae bacterium]